MPDTRRRRSVRSEAAQEFSDFLDRISTEKAKGESNLGAVVSMLEARVRKMQDDNFDLRGRNRDLKATNESLTQGKDKVPEGKTLVDTTAWTAAEAAQKALATLGVDAATIVTAYPKGQAALLDLAASTVGRAEGLSEQGTKALKRLITDHKLIVQTETVKVDDKDVARATVLVDGKPVPLRDHLKQQFAEYEPVIYAGTTASTRPIDPTRRMPATGTTTRPRATPDAGVAPTDVGRAVNSVLSRFQPAKPAGAAAT